MPRNFNVTKTPGSGEMHESPNVGRPCWSTLRKLRLRLLVGILVLIGAVALLMKMRNDAVQEANCTACRQMLKLIALVLLEYSETHGNLPPAYLCDETGKPVNSWRLLIADYAFYHRTVSVGYDVTQPWTAPGNSEFRLAERTVREFQCPSAADHRQAITNYVAVVGSDTMWPGSKPAKPAADGSDIDKILVIEVVNSDILWMEPRDLTLEQALDAIQPKAGIGSGHPSGINYVTVGGEVRTLDRNIDRDSLRRLLVRE